MIRATIVYLFIGVYILIFAPLGMLWIWISGDPAIVYSLARFCVRMAGWMAGVRVKVTGRENIRPGRNYVILSNHQGNADGPVLCHVIPRDFRALMKKEMMRLPLFSWLLVQVKFVTVDRSDPERARASISYGATLLHEGYSFVAFPEGTRSRDGRIGGFKKGVFIMAIQGGTPILPVSILHSRQIQPPGTYGIRPGTVEVVIHEPIETAGMSFEDRDRLIAMTREAILSPLPADQKSDLPAPVEAETRQSAFPGREE